MEERHRDFAVVGLRAVDPGLVCLPRCFWLCSVVDSVVKRSLWP